MLCRAQNVATWAKPDAKPDSPWSSWVDSEETASGGKQRDIESFDASSLLSSFSMDGDEDPRGALAIRRRQRLRGARGARWCGHQGPDHAALGKPWLSNNTDESLMELERLADTAGLEVVGCITQMLPEKNNRTYIGAQELPWP